MELQNLEKIEFDTLQLKPEIEPNNLRIDIIRQTYREPLNDSTVENKLTSYHPFGFYLGNGLFYDLNNNLCLRIDYLLNCSDSQHFEIKRTFKQRLSKPVTTYKLDSNLFTVRINHRKKDYENYKNIVSGDSTTFLSGNRFKYGIVKSDTAIMYRGEKRIWTIVNKRDYHNYYIKGKKRNESFQIEGDQIILDNDYKITLNKSKNTIEIKAPSKKGDRVLYTIIRDNNKMFIYNNKYFGGKILFLNNAIEIYWNNTFNSKYELD
jgi:hypothetical protein